LYGGRVRPTRLLPVLIFLLVAVAFSSFARPARADAKAEKEARALQKKAMEEDYLGTEFAAAQKKLEKAQEICGNDKCPAQQRAQIRRDLGVVLIGGQIDKDKGQAAFIEAFRLDAAITLDPDLKTKELEAAFEAARKKAGSGGGSTSAGGSHAAAGGVAGDFTHTPAPEGLVRTQVPVYVEYAGSENIVKVIVRYKGFGMTEFKPLQLSKAGNGWGAYVPCADVQQGNLQYYVQGFNDQNDPVATAGDRNNTYKVPIKTKIAGQPAALPGQPPPAQCADTGDCPPNFPGCKGQTHPGTKAEGADCEESSECSSGECKNGLCTAPAEGAGGTVKHRKIWLGASVAYGFSVLQQGSDVCKLDSTGVPLNKPAYYCVADGQDYPTRATSDQNNLLEPGKAGSIDGGFSPGSARIMFTFDLAPKPNYMIGARLGFVANNVYPGQEAQKDAKSNEVLKRIHVEARFTYLFGKDPLQRTAGYAFLGGGVSEFHGSVDVPVAESGAGQSRNVKAYLIGGPAFVTLGGGARFKLSPSAGLLLGPRVDLAIGYVGLMPVFGLEGGVQFGL
jgi:hypothetical protein